MSISWSLHLRREAASVPLARRMLIGAMETAGVDPDVSHDLSVALSEACANAVTHGGFAARTDVTDVTEVTEVTDAADVTDVAGASDASGAAGRPGSPGADGLPGVPGADDPSGPSGSPGADDPSGSPGAYRVTAYLDGEKCRIEVADSGPGFPSGPLRAVSRPVPQTAEHGRGLGLIEQLADHVHFGNRPDHAGAVVSFDKILKWRRDAPLATA